MKSWSENIIYVDATIKKALETIDKIGVASNALFVVNSNNVLLGSITDGDIRRGLLNGISVSGSITEVMNKNCLRLITGNYNTEFIKSCKEKGISIIPVVSDDGEILDVINLTDFKAVLPVTVVIMAGGKGERLMPLTKETPKPMLKIGDKPILEHNIDWLIKFGVKNFYISINYLGEKIVEKFGDGADKGIQIKYLNEKVPLGTIGSLSLTKEYEHDTILLLNSDLLTNIDYADLYDQFVKSEADMAVAAVSHHVNLPYAILETNNDIVVSLKEKPRYTYFANAGIYLLRRSLLDYLPQGQAYNATDLMDTVIRRNQKLIHFPILEYWLDIGHLSDFQKAQEDIKHINW